MKPTRMRSERRPRHPRGLRCHPSGPRTCAATWSTTAERSARLPIFLKLVTLMLACGLVGCERQPPWNVVIVTFDTTRADHLACYGHPGIQTPAVDSLATEGVLYENAYAPIPITLPSHSTVMTGKVPFTHGVRDNALFVLGEEQTTLAEILRAQGYRTAAAIGAHPLLAKFGIDQGFELFDDDVNAEQEDIFGDRIFPKSRLYFDERPAARVNGAILPWLEKHHAEPFFLWVHYFDPHHPLEPPAPYNHLYAGDPYLGEIAYADESLGTLLDRLRQLGVYDRTLIVFTSDHGEGRGEHDEATHSLLLYNSTLQVPLIIKPPAEAGSPWVEAKGLRIDRGVGTVDIVPTLLDLLGLEAPDDLQGLSLASDLDPTGKPIPTRREIYSETLSPRFSRDWGELRSLIVEDYKYVHGPRRELYDLEEDPRELRNLAEQQPELAAGFERRLSKYLSTHEVADLDSSVAVDEETVRRLQALGYMQSAGGPTGPIEETLRSDGDPPQDHIDTISEYSQAKNLLFQDRVFEAKEILDRLLKDDPDNPHYLEVLVSVEMRRNRPDEALLLLEQIEAMDTGFIPPEKLLETAGRILVSQGKIAEGLGKWQRAQALRETPEGQYQLAKIFELLGQVGNETRHLERSLELSPNLIAARIDLAIRYAKAKNVERAEAAFVSIAEDNPYHERVFYNFGAFLAETGRPEEAIGKFRRAVELKPSYHQAHYALFVLYQQVGRLIEAESSFEALHRLAPNSLEAREARRITGLEG